jgi:hypothetical protein
MTVLRSLAVLVAVFTMAAGAPLALAGNGAATRTDIYLHLTEREETFLPCDTDETVLYNILITYDYITHSTTRPNGSMFTVTETGTIVAWPPDEYSYLPTYTGHYSFSSQRMSTAESGVRTYTYRIQLAGDDGSTIAFASVEHLATDPNGVNHEVSLDNC